MPNPLTDPLPLVSIILPTYNGGRYITDAIRSILEQTYAQWELIVVEDGSSEPSREIVERFSDTRIHYVPLLKNRKLPGALNEGFRHAKGDLLTWTSDDNLYFPEALSMLVSALETHPQWDMVFSDMYLIDEAGHTIGFYSAGPVAELPRRSNLGACFLYRRKVYEALGDYDETLFLVEDYDYWLRVSAKFMIGKLDRVLYAYRQHSGQLTGLPRVKENALAHERVWRKHGLPVQPLYPTIWRRARYFLYRRVVRLGRWLLGIPKTD